MAGGRCSQAWHSVSSLSASRRRFKQTKEDPRHIAPKITCAAGIATTDWAALRSRRRANREQSDLRSDKRPRGTCLSGVHDENICVLVLNDAGVTSDEQTAGDGKMLSGKKITVVLPAYNAAATLRRTFDEIPKEIVDDVILTDDASSDDTVQIARALGIHTIVHDCNRGYGGNQKTCYQSALERGADIVVMLHPDYQYAPKLVTAMASMIASDEFDVVLASRILAEARSREVCRFTNT